MDINTRPVNVEQDFGFPAELVFDAWLKPALIREWLFVGAGSEIILVKVDPRMGGRFSILEQEQAHGRLIDHFGAYRKIDRPQRLVFTLSVPLHFAGETLVDIEISARPGGCRLSLIQTGVPSETTEKNWRDMLQQLEMALGKKKPA